MLSFVGRPSKKGKKEGRNRVRLCREKKSLRNESSLCGVMCVLYRMEKVLI